MKKHKILSVLLFLALICVVFSGCGASQEGLKFEIDNSQASVVSYKDKTTVSEIVIPDEYEGYPVTKVGEFGVMNAETLTKITIGKNVEEIGGWAFSGNPSLREFAVDAENKYFTAVDGILYTKDMKTLVYCPAAKEFENGVFEIPDTVETIRTKAFYKCVNIKEVIIPDTVKSIEEKSFHKCTALEKVTISPSSSLAHIGKDAFAYCEGIKEITLPSSVKQIDEYAFYNCKNLLKIQVNCKQSDVKEGKQWYPTNNGRDIDGLEIIWK